MRTGGLENFSVLYSSKIYGQNICGCLQQAFAASLGWEGEDIDIGSVEMEKIRCQ